MGTIHRILVPVDFSEPSRRALDYAAKLARPLGAAIDVLHVAEVPAFVPSASMPEAGASDLSLVALVREGADKMLTQFVVEAAARGIVVQASRLELGSPARVITELAVAGDYDLIVIGTHGRTGLTRALMGSVAERVVRHAPCPVLSVRPCAAPDPARPTLNTRIPCQNEHLGRGQVIG
ncbi:MAG TPA: universal stress protein [Polyangiaceae bacterium]|nr:universal stress protein [Polyangiaceae bacterium]